MLRRAGVLVALASAAMVAAAPSRASAQGVTPLVGVHEYTLVLPGDTLYPLFTVPNSDTSMLSPRGKVAIVRACGAPRMFLRVYHPVKDSTIAGAAKLVNPITNVRGWWAPITGDSTTHQVLDSTATTGPCSPAGAPSACQVDGSVSVDPMALPVPDCNLMRNRFLAGSGSALDSVLFRFIARTYPPPPQ